MNIKINKKDDIILKILHYFITEEDYKPVIINGLNNEIWLENMEKDLQLIRINTNYIHNNEQLRTDMFKAKTIMRSIKKSTFSLNINLLNLLIDTGDTVDFKDINVKGIETIKVGKINDFKKNEVVSSFFPKVKDSILNEKMNPEEFMRLTEDMNYKTIKDEKKLAKIFREKKPVLTYILMAINVAIYALTIIYGDSLYNMFANHGGMVASGQIYRLVTSMFLHGDIFHIGFNMYALYVLGPQVERYYGSLRFGIIYFLGGLLGSIFSCVFMNDMTISFGASGAIFALAGSVAYFTYHYRATLQGFLRSSIIPTLILNLCLGFMIPGIDFMCHIGGLIGGILISMAIGIGDKNRKADQINGAIVYILMVAFMVYMLLTK